MVVVAGDNPRAARIGAAVRDPDRLAETLRDVGVGWVLVAHVPGPAPVLPRDARLVMSGTDLDLYRLPVPVPAAGAGRGTTAAVVGADALALAVLLGAAVLTGRASVRRRRTSAIAR